MSANVRQCNQRILMLCRQREGYGFRLAALFLLRRPSRQSMTSANANEYQNGSGNRTSSRRHEPAIDSHRVVDHCEAKDWTNDRAGQWTND